MARASSERQYPTHANRQWMRPISHYYSPNGESGAAKVTIQLIAHAPELFTVILSPQTIPANARRLPNVGSMLARRLRRRSSIEQTLGEYRQFKYAALFPPCWADVSVAGPIFTEGSAHDLSHFLDDVRCDGDMVWLSHICTERCVWIDVTTADSFCESYFSMSMQPD